MCHPSPAWEVVVSLYVKAMTLMRGLIVAELGIVYVQSKDQKEYKIRWSNCKYIYMQNINYNSIREPSQVSPSSMFPGKDGSGRSNIILHLYQSIVLNFPLIHIDHNSTLCTGKLNVFLWNIIFLSVSFHFIWGTFPFCASC